MDVRPGIGSPVRPVSSPYSDNCRPRSNFRTRLTASQTGISSILPIPFRTWEHNIQ